MQHRYLLCILAPEALANEVDRMGREAFPAKSNLRGSSAPVHITLILLDMNEEHEPALVSAIASGVSGAQPFVLHINGITHFADQRTIYADPVEKNAVLELTAPVAQLVNAFAEVHGCTVKVADHPHLTIASGLKPGQFHQAWAGLGARPFEARMEVGEVTLLKRSLTPGSSYVELQRFALG